MLNLVIKTSKIRILVNKIKWFNSITKHGLLVDQLYTDYRLTGYYTYGLQVDEIYIWITGLPAIHGLQVDR